MDDLRAAVRALRATPLPALVIVVTLATAIGANAAIFTVVNGLLWQPIYPDDDSLAVVWGTSGELTGRLSPADYRDVRENVAAFDGQVALYRAIGSTLTGLDDPVQVGSYAVTARLFRTLGVEPAIGRFFPDSAETPGGPRRVVITHASWTTRFGADPDLVGDTIELDGQPYVVEGVTRPGFQFPPGDNEAELYFPMALSDSILLDRDHRMFDAIARVAPSVTIAGARAEIDALARQLAVEYPATNTGWGLTLEPLRNELLGDLRPTLLVLSGAVFLVLLTACANIANLLVARSTDAGTEFAVRAAMGARPRDLCRRSLAESALLGVVGGGLGIGLAYLGVGLLRGFMPADIPRASTLSVDGTVVAVAVGLTVGAILVFGALPAVRSMRPALGSLLKPAAGGAGHGGARRVRESMVVVEVALAVVLTIGAALMVGSFARLNEVDPGFREDGVVSMAVRLQATRHTRAEWRTFFERVVDGVVANDGVRAAGAVSDLPMSEVGLGLELEFQVPGLDAVRVATRPYGNVRFVIPGYFEAMGIELVRGRPIERLDASSDRNVAVVNETLVEQYFPHQDPLGQRMQMEVLGEVEIVGVVRDVRHTGLASKYEAEVFIPYGRLATAEMHLVAWSDLPPEALGQVLRQAVADVDPSLRPRAFTPLGDLVWESAARSRFNATLLSVLAACAALLAVVGTYGIVAYSVLQRRREIGVRMALGADSSSTVRMVVGATVRVVGCGALLGVAGAFVVADLLDRLIYAGSATAPGVYLSILGAALGVAVVAAWIPARRAARIDPARALREG